MRVQLRWMAVLLLLTGCAATGGTPRALPPDPNRRMQIYISDADSAQVIDALGRRLNCNDKDCVVIPGAEYGQLERRALRVAFGPEISPPLRLIAWARTPALYPQIELFESHNVSCFVADIPDASAGMKCEWILDITPSDSLTNCKLSLTRLYPKPANGKQ